MAKTDRRVRYTKQAIKDSLFELLKTVSIDQVTVKALCEQADINRATFYKHYETLSALLEEIEYEESRELFELLDAGFIDERHVENTLTKVIYYLKKHVAMREVFLGRGSTGTGLTRWSEEYQQRIIERMSEKGKLSRKEAEWMLLFVISGVREVLRRWFEEGMENEEMVKRLLITQIRSGMGGLLQ